MSNTWVHQAQCPTCGVVRLTSKEITLYVHPSITELGTYSFTCPMCSHTIVKASSRSIIDYFRNTGVRVVSAISVVPDMVEWHSLIHNTEDLYTAITKGGE